MSLIKALEEAADSRRLVVAGVDPIELRTPPNAEREATVRDTGVKVTRRVEVRVVCRR